MEPVTEKVAAILEGMTMEELVAFSREHAGLARDLRVAGRMARGKFKLWNSLGGWLHIGLHELGPAHKGSYVSLHDASEFSTRWGLVEVFQALGVALGRNNDMYDILKPVSWMRESEVAYYVRGIMQ